MKQLAALLSALLLVLAGRAATVQVKGSYGDVIGTATFTWQASGTNTAVFDVICQGNTGGVKLQLSTSGGTPGNFTGSGGLEPGQYTSFNKGVLVWARGNSRNIDQGPDIYGPFTIGSDGSGGEGPPPKYELTFPIPANPTDHPITYNVVQSGNQVSTFVQAPGAGPVNLKVGDLAGSTPLHLNEVTPGVKLGPGGVFENDPGGPGYVREVGVGIPTQTGGTTPPPSVSVTPPNAPTSGGTPAPPAPSIVINVGDGLKPVWVPKGEVNPGTAPGQSTSDFTIAAYREGVDKQVAGWRSEAQRIIDGANANTAAAGAKVDAVTAAVNSASAEASTKANQANEKLEAIRVNTLSAANTLGAVKTILDAQSAAPVKLVEDPNAFNETWRDAQISTAQTKAEAVTYSGPSVTGSEVNVQGDSYSASQLGKVSVAGEQIAFSLSADDMGAAASGFSIFTACRGLLLLAACIGFIYSCSDTVNVYVASLGNSGGGGQALGGIETAVPGVVQAKHLASSSAIALAVMAGAAAIIAFVDTVAGRYGVGLGALLDSLDLGPIGPAYGFLDQFMPIAALTALAVLRAAFPYFVAPVYLAAANLARFAHI